MPCETIDQIKEFLGTKPSEEELKGFLGDIKVNDKPTAAFHQLDLQSVK
jgi:hypothetical protein